MSADTRLTGAVEAGGTKFRAAVHQGSELVVLDEIRVPTTTPEETLGAITDFFRAQATDHGRPIESLGIASFGPLIVDRSSPDFGSMASTPKPGWSGAPMLSQLASDLGVPADIQTDVEAAAVAEAALITDPAISRVVYITVGTGIGVGIAIDGVPFRGIDHLEMGHIPVERHPDDTFPGRCPFHQSCLEGMACGPAIADRWGQPAEELGDRPEVWAMEADYLAQLASVLVYSFSPDRILYSGGVGARPEMAPLIANRLVERLAGYSVSLSNNPDLVATATLGNEAGLTGAGLLARSLGA